MAGTCLVFLAAAVPLCWEETLWIFALSGLFGGALGTLRLYDTGAIYTSAVKKRDALRAQGEVEPAGTPTGTPEEKKRSADAEKNRQAGIWAANRQIAYTWLLNGLGGVGGAFAGLFFLVLSNQITPKNDHLLYATWGFVAGFIGLQLLSLAADALTKRIENVAERKASEVAKNETEGLKQELAIRAGLYATAGEASTDDVADAKKKLAEALGSQPWNRRLIIVYGNVIGVKDGNSAEAINILTKGLAALSAKDPNAKVDLAAITYNIACYTWRQAQTLPVADPAFATLKTEALKRLKDACTLDPALKNEAKTDKTKDWDTLLTANDPAFLQAIA